MAENNKNSILKIIFALIVITIIAGGVIGYILYMRIYSDNVSLPDGKVAYLYIPTGATISTVYDSLYSNDYIINKKSFEWVAEKKNYKNHIRPGKYQLTAKMSNNRLINILRGGMQTPVKVTFNNIRLKTELAGRIAGQIEADSASIIKLLKDKTVLADYGFNENTILAMFIPNTYELYWNTSAKQFLERMNKEYRKFWNEKRQKRAEAIGLTPYEVSILASIVQAEQSTHNDEKPTIAGVYINRLNQDIPLEACPTLVYAIGDFSIKRVLEKDKKVESPYNTYMNKGLPPGPINLPEISSIDAVLNYKKHDYIFMCAKEDFSGYHYFSKTLSQHKAYAKKYWRELNRRGINR